MKIAIDGRLLSGKMTGISRYLWNIIKYLPIYDKKNEYYLFHGNDVNIDEGFFHSIIVPESKLPRQVYSHYWVNYKLPKFLVEYKIDLFFTPYLLAPPKIGNYKNIIVIHDSMPKIFKDFYSFHYRKYMQFAVPRNLKKSDAILTVSNSAKNDLIKFNNADIDNTYFMHLWADNQYRPRIIDEQKRDYLSIKYGLPSKYILYVGAIEKRKNILGILQISDILFSKGIEIKIVLVGNNGYGSQNIQKEIDKRGERIIKLSYVEENDLPLIYNSSKIFLFPSYYEGFGLPPLEAMKSGIPVLSSNNSSLIEVIGQGGFLNNADDYSSFANQIESLLTDNEFYKSMVQNALKQAENFTPELQLPKLLEIFEVVYNK